MEALDLALKAIFARKPQKKTKRVRFQLDPSQSQQQSGNQQSNSIQLQQQQQQQNLQTYSLTMNQPLECTSVQPNSNILQPLLPLQNKYRQEILQLMLTHQQQRLQQQQRQRLNVMQMNQMQSHYHLILRQQQKDILSYR